MNILFLTDKYYPKPLANAICVQEVAKSFIKIGHHVDVLIYEDTGIKPLNEKNGINIFSVKPDLRMRLFYYAKNNSGSTKASLAATLASFMSKSKQIMRLNKYPLYSYSFPKRIVQKMKALNVGKKYDLVISAFSPFEAVLAALWFKQEYPKCKWCIYALDPFINRRCKFIPLKYRSLQYWLPRFLEKADILIYMKSRKKELDCEQYVQWKQKIAPSDIPLLTDTENSNNDCDFEIQSDVEIWTYAGSLGAPHYLPQRAIECFLGLPENKKRKLYFYGAGKEWDQIKIFSKQTDGKIQCHSYVDHEELIKVYENSNILVSIKNSDEISAKIFEYMSYGKKIVHFSGCKNDPNVQYINDYGKGAVIHTWETGGTECIQELVSQLAQWDENPNQKPVDLSLFRMNRPEYTRDLILKRLDIT